MKVVATECGTQSFSMAENLGGKNFVQCFFQQHKTVHTGPYMVSGSLVLFKFGAIMVPSAISFV